MQVIVCPVDYSPHSSAAFKLVCQIARPNHSKVILLHVSGHSDKPLTLEESWLQRSEAGIREQILTDNEIEVEALTLSGDPVEVIARTVERLNADLIVMGTQGKTGLSRLMLGSVAQGVLSKVKCAVVTIRPELA